MALNITRFAGNSRIRGQAVFLGTVGRIWKAEDTTETHRGSGPARDVRARQADNQQSASPVQVERDL